MLVPVSDLIERVRLDCDLPTFDANTHVTATAVLDYIRRGASKLAGLIQEVGASEQYLTLSTTLTTTPNIATVSLPANTNDVQRLAIVIDSNREIQLEVAPLDGWDPGPAWWSDPWQVPRYRLIGNTITLFPTPTTARDIRAYYTIGFTVTSTADILALRPNWDEVIVSYACTLVRNRQNKDAGEFRAAYGESTTNLVRQIRRDRNGINQIRDVRHDAFGPCGRRGWYWP
ncbi:MAG TPA: hypothetical protein VEL28_01625 [Candidatus Binatia bacterium]|nr:hypothetical protein [Candidatus Binatia bacterium]